ncbi:MAG: LruC domain-containing protein [Bacteroidetes bacterium]|nr:LruC domain-containing protein [Bacteroidota bacterium]
MKSHQNLKCLALFLAIILTIVVGCKKENEDKSNPAPTPINSFGDIVADPAFDWSMQKDIQVNITAKDNNDGPLVNVRFDIYTDDPENGGIKVFSGFTGTGGTLQTTFPAASYRESFVITTRYIGLPNIIEVPVSNGILEYTFGGKNKTASLKGTAGVMNPDFLYLGTYNSLGVPDYLEPVGDVIPQDMLDDINAALPEYYSVPVYHPEYLAANNETSYVLIEDADVWVTFVHEGAGYTNTLGFFTYPVGNPPATVNDIPDVTIILPNASFDGSGGGLFSGDKVYIGQFTANTVIAWVLIADGWDNGQVTYGRNMLYSEPYLNPETDPQYQQHNVQLFDSERGVILNGFEDIERPGGDNDFNDLIFYVTANPITAAEIINLPPLDPGVPDGDGDGIDDPFDDYPTDPERALNLYYPGENEYGSLIFEDLWPAKGDYDFNDLVLDCNFTQVLNSSNEVKDILAEFKVRAVGASFRNGFGFMINTTPGNVVGITGQNLQENLVTVNANGTETGQNEAVVVVFDNVFNTFPHNSIRFINTKENSAYENPAELSLALTLTDPVALQTMGAPPYNPFLIINLDRGRETHPADYPPTALANLSYFGTEDDNSIPASGRYYKTITNLPWCLYVPEEFDYPIETRDITSAHLKLVDWVNSGGTAYTDWYHDEPGYRNAQNIYTPQ